MVVFVGKVCIFTYLRMYMIFFVCGSLKSLRVLHFDVDIQNLRHSKCRQNRTVSTLLNLDKIYYFALDIPSHVNVLKAVAKVGNVWIG
jgi:hypothetical protein